MSSWLLPGVITRNIDNILSSEIIDRKLVITDKMRSLLALSYIPGDRIECSMEYNQSVSGSQWQSVVVCGSLW